MDFWSAEQSSSLRSRIFPRLAGVNETDGFPTSPLQRRAFIILFSFPSVALLVIALRVYSRQKMKQFGWDDVIILIAMALSLAETCVAYFAIKYTYLGIHFEDVPRTADWATGLNWMLIGQALYNPILGIVKSSVLFFLLRLIGHKRPFRYAIHILNAFNISLTFSVTVVSIFQCQPVSYFWERMADLNAVGTCIDSIMFYIVSATLTIVTDLAVLALPFFIFLGLQMPLKQRLVLMSVFLLGFAVTTVSILRLAWLIEIKYFPWSDCTYDIRICFSAVETNLGIITASAPALQPLLKSWFPRVFGTLNSGTRGIYDNRAGMGSSHDLSKSLHDTNKRNTDTSRPSTICPLKARTVNAMRDLKRGTSVNRDKSPTGSEDDIMTYHGILRTMEVDVYYGDDDALDMMSFEEQKPEPKTRFGDRHQPYP